MTLVRREVLAGGLALAVTALPAAAETPLGPMHGLIGRMRAVAGQRDALLQILLEGTSGMPGCLPSDGALGGRDIRRSFLIAADHADPVRHLRPRNPDGPA